MRITRLTLVNFRNHARTVCTPPGGLTLFTGDNAQGKTSILEAVFLCAMGRSHRTARDKELIRWDAQYGRVALELERGDGRHSVEIIMPSDKPRVIRIDGQPIKRVGELMGKLNCVLFAPEDLSLIKEGPAERRRFLDMELSQLYPTYFYALSRYSKALAQRNSLLKQIKYTRSLRATLPSWDEQLCEAGAFIIGKREAFLERLAAIAARNHLSLTDGERLTVRYAPSLDTRKDDPAEYTQLIAGALERALETDIQRGYTSVGPHRDDIAIELGGADARAFGSQGQQRTAALSLKLSELDLLTEELGEPPVLLLDDVLSELDERRQSHLLSRLGGIQTFMTAAALNPDAALPAQAHYIVTGGEIEAAGNEGTGER